MPRSGLLSIAQRGPELIELGAILRHQCGFVGDREVLSIVAMCAAGPVVGAVEDRLAVAKKAQEPKPRADEHYSLANQAWRMVIELVAGLGIGFGIGYGLDSLLGTIPIFLVLFTLLGLAAGVKTMLRSAQEIQEQKLAEQAEEDEKARGRVPANGETD